LSWVRTGQQVIKVFERAERRVDLAIVGDVVPGVGSRGPVERGKPDGIDAESGEIAQASGDAGQVASAVTISVREGLGPYLVDHRRTPPGRAGRLGRRRK